MHKQIQVIQRELLKVFFEKKSAPIYSALFHEKKIIRIFQAEIMQEPTVEKRCT